MALEIPLYSSDTDFPAIPPRAVSVEERTICSWDLLNYPIAKAQMSVAIGLTAQHRYQRFLNEFHDDISNEANKYASH